MTRVQLPGLGAVLVTIGVTIGIGMGWTAAVGGDSGTRNGASESKLPVPLDLFRTWNFDRELEARPPAGFSPFTLGSAEAPLWMVQPDPEAPSKPNIVRQSALCSGAECWHGLLVDDLVYDYADITVRVRLAESPVDASGSAGLAFSVRDATNFYAATADLTGERVQLIRVVDGQATVLAQTSVTSKPLAWHVMRVRHDTIISKEFVEVIWDGVQVLSFQGTDVPPGRIGLLTRGPAMVAFDSLNASPLYSQKPLSPPAAY